VPSHDLNLGLPYGKPAHYQLSHAASSKRATLHPNQNYSDILFRMQLAAALIVGLMVSGAHLSQTFFPR
jgi:hypothetical protein